MFFRHHSAWKVHLILMFLVQMLTEHKILLHFSKKQKHSMSLITLVTVNYTFRTHNTSFTSVRPS